MLGENLAADGASGRIAATGATMNRDDAALMIFDGIENFLEGVGGMGVVYDDGERLALVDDVHATLDGSERFDAGFDLVGGEVELFTN